MMFTRKPNTLLAQLVAKRQGYSRSATPIQDYYAEQEKEQVYAENKTKQEELARAIAAQNGLVRTMGAKDYSMPVQTQVQPQAPAEVQDPEALQPEPIEPNKNSTLDKFLRTRAFRR